MKIDRGKVKKVPADPPLDTKNLIQNILAACAEEKVLLGTLQEFRSWNASKCELFHWTEVLNRFDDILASATESSEWMLACDVPNSQDAATKRHLTREILRFTSLLVEHSFSRHLYNSMDRLIALLSSRHMNIVQSVLSLLYTFSKRSSFLTRLKEDNIKGLFLRLQLLAETWGGKVNGFGLAKCCEDVPLDAFPATATTVHFEFFSEQEIEDENGAKRSVTNVIHLENVEKLKPKTVPEIMRDLVREYNVPESKQIPLYFHLRLAYSFADYKERLSSVHSRLLALAILAYTSHVPENVTSYIYSGLVEELVDVLQLKSNSLLDLKSTVMRTLTAVVHHDRGSRCMDIIDATSSSSYHGFLPVLVRTCIQALTENRRENFPAQYATAIFSFLYHMASYESGGEALVSCGMMESMLKVVNWYDTTEENITFVTRAVRVIDLITNMDMASFQNHNGLSVFTKRLEHEVGICRKEQPNVLHEEKTSTESEESTSGTDNSSMDVEPGTSTHETVTMESTTKSSSTEVQCFPQRAALLKSILNFFKKIIPDGTFTDSIRHLMDGSLPSSLKHIISNAEYYGSSLFLLATDIVTVYVFQEPGMLSALQDRGLTDVILQAVLVKDLPPTREVLSAIPNICSALCLNARGLQAFVACKPFEKLFKVLLSPDYLPAMRRRRTNEGYGDTAASLGGAVDELMRHQPTLRAQAMQDVVKLLQELCSIGRDSKFVCQVSGSSQQTAQRPARGPDHSIPGDSSDDDDEYEDSQQGGTASFHTVPSGLRLDTQTSTTNDSKEKTVIPLMDYIINACKFVEAVLISNSTEDHCQEFVRQGGLKPLMEIFRLPNLPLEFPYSHACQAANGLVKNVMAYCRNETVLTEAFSHMDVVLKEISELRGREVEAGGSSMLSEWSKSTPNNEEALRDAQNTPLLHRLCYMHSYVSMMNAICKLSPVELRSVCTNTWVQASGIDILEKIADLYSFLIWENTILIALCSEENVVPQEGDMSKSDLKALLASRKLFSEEEKSTSSTESESRTLSASSSESRIVTPMDVDNESSQPSTSAAVAVKKSSSQIRAQINIVKLLKPLITIATKLCRTTGELFSLMVKFVNVKAQRRHGAVVNRGEIPSENARKIAETVAKLMTKVINQKGPFVNVPTRFKLNYLMCVVGFLQPLIFDEKRHAYHFMLQKFISVGVADAFFGAFRTVMKDFDMNKVSTERTPIGQFTVDFAVTWLSMLEKLLNPKNIVESQNTLPPSRIAIPGYVAPFDPVPYYVEMLNSTLQVIDKFLSVQALKNFGENAGDLLLTILSHIMKIEAIIKEKSPGTSTIASVTPGEASAAAGTAAPAVTARPADNAPPIALQALLDMGFTREAAAEALVYHANNVEQAADYLLASEVLGGRGPRGIPGATAEVNEEQDELMQAIAMSIGGTVTPVASPPPPAPAVPPTTEQIDQLIDKALPLCIELVDFIPECVFKVADLMSVISKRNGNDWKLKRIKALIGDAIASAAVVIQSAERFYNGSEQSPADSSPAEVLRSAPDSLTLSARLHLLCILIEETQDECGRILENDNLIPLLINLISAARRIHSLVIRGTELVPKWLAFAYLILDSYEKMCAAFKRKRVIQEQFAPTWKVFDNRAGKWSPFTEAQSKELSEAYDRGKSSCKLQSPLAGPGQRGGTSVVRFKDMVQIVEGTGSKRPVMRDLKKKEPVPEKPETKTEDVSKDSAKLSTESSDLTSEMQKVEATKSPSEDSPMQIDQDQVEVKSTSNTEPLVLNGLLMEQRRALINDTLSLIHQKLDPDTLHAAMRMLLRFTRDYELARHFAELSGPQILMALDARSYFDSFSSFLTHLIRHVIENSAVLQYSMEKFCSWLTYGVVSTIAGTTGYVGNATREGNYVMRVAWPGAARNPDKFIECAKRVIHFNVPPTAGAPTARPDDSNNRVDLVKPTPPVRNMKLGQDQPEAYNKVLQQLVADLLNQLVQPWEPEVKPVTEKKEAGREATGTQPSNSERSSRTQPTTDPSSSAAGYRNLNLLHQLLQHTTTESDLSSPSFSSSSDDQNIWKSSDKINKPILNKSMTLRILAELVKSYNHVASFILSHSYGVEQGPLVKEDINALGFVLDNFIHTSQKAGDEYCPYSARVLMAALAAAFEHPAAQLEVVDEVKHALQRATVLPENQEKHERISALANIIHTMVEACPTRVADPTGDRNVQFVVNQMARCMAKRNLINDLAKIPHSLDLRSPYLAATINCVLRPLETLTRLAAQQDKPRTKARFGQNGASGRSTTAGNAEASDITQNSAIDESQRTDHDIAPLTDDTINIQDGADMSDLYFLPPSMDVDTDNNMDEEDGEEAEVRHERRNLNRRDMELEISMDEETSENEDEIVPVNPAEEEGEGGYQPDEADDDEEMQDDDDDEEDEDDEDDEEDEDEFIEPAGLAIDQNANAAGRNPYEYNVGRFDGIDWDDEERNAEDDMLFHLEDLFPGATGGTFHAMGAAGQPFGLEGPGGVLFELNAGGPGAIGSELQNGSTGTRQLPPPLAISSSHPLLSRPPIAADGVPLPVTAAANRLGIGSSDIALAANGRGGARLIRVRAGQGAAGGRLGGGRLNPPAILQTLLGPNFRLYAHDIGGGAAAVEIPERYLARSGLNRGPAGVLWGDHDYATGAARQSDSDDLQVPDDPVFLGTAGLVASLPSLVKRWSEEARVLDGDNVIECADVTRPSVLPGMEAERDEAVKEIKKNQPEAPASSSLTAPTIQLSRRSYRPAGLSASAEGGDGRLDILSEPTSESIMNDIARLQETVQMQSEAVNALSEAVAGRIMQEMESDSTSENENSEDYSSHLSEDTDNEQQETSMVVTEVSQHGSEQPPQPPPPIPMDISEAVQRGMEIQAQLLRDDTPQDFSQLPAPNHQNEGPAIAAATQPNESTSNAGTTATVTLQYTPAEPTTNSALPQEASTSSGQAQASGGIYPEGIDPSFLEALPESMRQEVIADFLRMQRQNQQRAARSAAAAAASAAALTAASASTPTTAAGAPPATGETAPGVSAPVAPAAAPLEISADFLAALPPNIQEEVLAQQRAEQARAAAATASPDAPFDPANFIQSLAPSLRRQILADIDDTLLGVLPDTVAQEARTLRREVEHRHVFAHGGGPGGLAFDGDVIAFMRGRFPTLARRTGGAAGVPSTARMGSYTNYAARGGARRAQQRLRVRPGDGTAAQDWFGASMRTGGWDRGAGQETMRGGEFELALKGTSKPILDYEGLTCLLVLYFLNTPAINIGRIQRTFKNICHHAATREWVFEAVMSMLKKADDSKAQEAKKLYSTIKPNWLNISIEAALGCRANVFQLMPKQLKKPQTLQAPVITIHPQAAQVVCANLLDCLMLLAKNFPEQFVPYAIKLEGKVEKERSSKSPVRSASKALTPSKTSAANQDFWEILVRLDAQIGSGVRKGGKSSGKAGALGPTHVVELLPNEPLRMVDFVNSGLGQLIMMLLSETFHKIPDLSDRLLRLIASIAINVHKRDLGIPVLSSAVTKSPRNVIRLGKLTKRDRDMILWKAAITRFYNPDNLEGNVVSPVPIVETEGGDYTADLVDVSAALTKYLSRLDSTADLFELKDQVSSMAVDLCHLSTTGAIKFSLSVEHEQLEEISGLLRKLVDVLISRRCSEEGLEDITHTLIMLAQRLGTSVRQDIIQMLLEGIRKLSVDVTNQIETLNKEAIAYNNAKLREKSDLEGEEHSSEGNSDGTAKGVLPDRFSSGENVVLYKPKGKTQGGSEVHLSGMTQLTGKASSQTFMLKLLKVMIDLRGTARTLLRVKTSDKSDEWPNGTMNIIARRLLEMSYRHRQRKMHPETSAMDVDESLPFEPEPLAASTPNDSTDSEGSTLVPREGRAGTSRPVIASAEPEVDLPPLSELLNVEDLWNYLSSCLGELEKTGDQNAVLILQPTVESFFLVHATEKRNADKREMATRQVSVQGNQDLHAALDEVQPSSPAPAAGESASINEQSSISSLPLDVQKFLRFAETHRVVLNQILRQSTVPLSEGPFAVLVDHTRVLDFDVKRKYFRHELERIDAHRIRREDVALRIRRAHIFEDSFRDLHRKPAEDWKGRFYIMFDGEEGQDAGGLLREWYSVISREIFNPNYALFQTSPGDRVTYMINSQSNINSNHLSYFKFVGRLIAKAIYDNKLLDCFFTRSYYKHILGKPVRYTDMESEDYSFYQGLVYLLNHSVDEVGSEIYFSTEVREFGVTEVRDLKPNGRNIPVTDENKQEYVRLACQMKMTHSIRKQLDSFLEGFYEIIPKRLISIFNEQELELLISGLPNIDVDDLKTNTDYHKYQQTSLQIIWFWRALRSFDQADRAKFLQFVTGTSKVPLQGFAALEGMSGAQKFQIHRDDRSTDRLPSAHTCFNQLDLPAYEDYDKLRAMLQTAIHECSEGFGFA